MQDSRLPATELTAKLPRAEQGGAGVGTDVPSVGEPCEDRGGLALTGHRFSTRTPRIFHAERKAFSTNGAGTAGYKNIKNKRELDHHLAPCVKINAKSIKDLDLRAKTVTVSEGNTDITLCDCGLGSGFLLQHRKHKNKIKKKEKELDPTEKCFERHYRES